MLTQAGYYPRNTVIPVVIPKKSCFCQEGKWLRSVEIDLVNPILILESKSSSIGSSGLKFESKWKVVSKNEVNSLFCSFFCFLTFLSVASFRDHHFVVSCVSHTCSPCLALGICLRYVHLPSYALALANPCLHALVWLPKITVFLLCPAFRRTRKRERHSHVSGSAWWAFVQVPPHTPQVALLQLCLN